MSVECAACDRYACRVGRIDAAPDDCPMHGDFPAFEDLYGTDAIRTMAYHAARVEAEGYCRWTRIREIREFAGRMGIARIGIAHCPDMAREAELTAGYLRRHGLEAVLPEEATRCDPRGQARELAAAGTGLNVLAGLCVGHDALFIRASRAPVTSLVIRDRRLRHNPVAALYTRRGYLKSALYRRGEPPGSTPFQGWDDEVLEAAAARVRDSGTERRTRLEEVMDFARELGARHLGIVFCSGFREEARHLSAVLGTNGFRVSSVCCKSGAVPKDRLGIRDPEKVRPGQAEMICNPVAQARLLDREGIQLALLLGQCVGHDSATMAHLRAPAVCVVTKDRVLAHNTVAALYELERGSPSLPGGH